MIVGGVIALPVLMIMLPLAGWWAWRRFRRSGLMERGMLQVRATVLPAGHQREIAELRLELHTQLEQTRRVLSSLDTDTAGLQQLADLLARLRQTTTGLDVHLQLSQGEPDQGYLAEALPALRERAEAAQRDVLSLRQAALRLHSEADYLQRTRPSRTYATRSQAWKPPWRKSVPAASHPSRQA